MNAELHDRGFYVLRAHFGRPLVETCRAAFWPVLLEYLRSHADEPNRGPYRHCLPMPFDPPCFAPEFFFDPDVLGIVRGAMGNRIVADQWHCDVPLRGSVYQDAHVDYRHPLFSETPDLPLPAYMLAVSLPLTEITLAHGPIEIAPGTHRMARTAAFECVAHGEIAMEPVPLQVGDVLIRHPWALHRGTPNTTDTPRALVTIRYVRQWYADASRDVNAVPRAVWDSLSPDQRSFMRFPIGE
ncbi:MAG: phytanoyl-CoA dioxygenase family protein [Bryobacteraceae bacterium]|jgi:ectoine hydroxylase-related dioxygenase (phytanoyl-CoA dioxygenase family)